MPESTDKAAGSKPETVGSSHWRFSLKQGAFENFASFTGKNLCWSLFLIKLQFWRPATLLEKTLTLVLSCETCKLFKNNYFEEYLIDFYMEKYMALSLMQPFGVSHNLFNHLIVWNNTFEVDDPLTEKPGGQFAQA